MSTDFFTTAFDEKLKLLEDLKWLPWIGNQYPVVDFNNTSTTNTPTTTDASNPTDATFPA